MIKYINYNANPKNKKAGDCVIRAIARATNQSWDTVYAALCELGAKYKLMPNSKRTFEKYLDSLNFTKHPQPRKDDGTKYTVREMSKFISAGIIAVVQVANHTTVIEGDTLYDTWDCRDYTVLNFYTRRATV